MASESQFLVAFSQCKDWSDWPVIGPRLWFSARHHRPIIDFASFTDERPGLGQMIDL